MKTYVNIYIHLIYRIYVKYGHWNNGLYLKDIYRHKFLFCIVKNLLGAKQNNTNNQVLEIRCFLFSNA